MASEANLFIGRRDTSVQNSCMYDLRCLRSSFSKFAALMGSYCATIWTIVVIFGSLTFLKVPDVCTKFENFCPDGKGSLIDPLWKCSAFNNRTTVYFHSNLSAPPPATLQLPVSMATN